MRTELDSNTKRCTKCGEEKTLDCFRIYRRSGNYEGRCKACHLAYDRARNNSKPMKRYGLIIPDGYKFCSKCETIKPISNFGKDKSIKDGLQSRCKVCQNKSYIDYRKGREDILNAKKRQWALNNKDKVRVDRNNWDKNNPDKLKQRRKLASSELKNYYVHGVMVSTGIDAKIITPELIELKRIIIKTKRLCKQNNQ